MGSRPKISQSYAKAGDPIAKVSCLQEAPLYVACRNEMVGERVKEVNLAYLKISDKELEEGIKELETYFACDGDIEQKLNYTEDGVPLCYQDNMSQKTICLLNNIKKMSGIAQVVQAYKAFHNRYFEHKGMEADWARLLSLWVFEYDETTENDSTLCLTANKTLSYFLNEQNIKNVPKFTKCNTNDIGNWKKDGYVSTIERTEKFDGKPLLIFNKNSAYIRDIMKRKPYIYGIKQIKRVIRQIPKNRRTKESIKKSIEKIMESRVADFSFKGPLSGTDEYNVLEWFLGSYNTDIYFEDYNETTGEVKVRVVTENMSHWQSAMRLPEAVKKQKFMEYFGNPEYLYDNKEIGVIGDFDVERLDMVILMLPSQLISSGIGVYSEYKLSGGKTWDTISGVWKIDKKYVNYYKAGIFAHNFFGGSFIQRFEGEDTITVDDLWLREVEVYFDLDKSDLAGFRRDQALQILDSIVNDAKSRNCKLKLEIKGYADSIGRESYNKGLSQKRADTVMNYLGSRLVLQEASSVGYGEKELLVPSMPESALNRRVTILIEEII